MAGGRTTAVRKFMPAPRQPSSLSRRVAAFRGPARIRPGLRQWAEPPRLAGLARSMSARIGDPLAGSFPFYPFFLCAGVAAGAGKQYSVHDAALPHVVDQAQHRQEGHQVGSPVTHQRQRQACDRQLVGHHPDIDHYVKKQ